MTVVDASVAVKWVVTESDSSLAAGLLDGRQLFAPDLLWAECGSVLWSKVRRGVLLAREAELACELLRSATVHTTPSQSLVGRALSLALRLEHSVYGCLYLALAMQLECPLITADHRFAERVAASGIAPGSVHRLVG